MGCELLRACYRSLAKLDKDQDRLWDLRWFWCAPGAKVLPVNSAVLSPTWASGLPLGPFIGIDPKAKRAYDLGETPPSKLGRCYRGRSDQFIYGQSTDDPVPPYTDCCPQPEVEIGELFLRSDLFPDVHPPAGFVLPWDNGGTAPEFFGVLSPEAGLVPNETRKDLIAVQPILQGQTLGTIQYLSAPFTQGVLYRTTLRVASGWQVRNPTNVNGAFVFGLALLSSEGVPRTYLVPLQEIDFPSNAALGIRTRLVEVDIPQTQIQAGDYLCLELGFVHGTHPGLGPSYHYSWWDAGETELLADNAPVSSPQSILGDLSVIMPAGTIVPYAGLVVPAGYLACDGAPYEQADFPRLFRALGTTWNLTRGASAPADGMFRVPDLRGLTVLGSGSAGASPATSLRVLGATGGEEAHSLTDVENGQHIHNVTDPGHDHTPQNGTGSFVVRGGAPNALGYQPSASLTHHAVIGTEPNVTGISVDLAGGGVPHNTLQPFAVVQWLIKF